MSMQLGGNFQNYHRQMSKGGKKANQLPAQDKQQPVYNTPSYTPGNGVGNAYGNPHQMFGMMFQFMQMMHQMLGQMAQQYEQQYPTNPPPVTPPPVTPPPVTPPPVTPPPVTPPPVTPPPVTPPPVTPPPVTPPPVTPPPVTPPPTNFPPGTLPVGQVPVDAQGNMTQDFVRGLFTPSNAVNTNLLDANSPSGMTKFALVGIRMMGHDLYDGEINGDVAFRSLLAPDQSHNKDLVDTAEEIDIVKEWGRRDLNDDGRFNGSVYAKLIEDVWPQTDDVNIAGFAGRLNFNNSSLNAAEMFRTTTDVASQAGMTEFVENTNFTGKELFNFALWGHRIMDENFTTQALAQDALTNPRSIDFGPAHFNAETLAYTQSLTTDPNAKSTVGLGVLNFIMKALR